VSQLGATVEKVDQYHFSGKIYLSRCHALILTPGEASFAKPRR